MSGCITEELKNEILLTVPNTEEQRPSGVLVIQSPMQSPATLVKGNKCNWVLQR